MNNVTIVDTLDAGWLRDYRREASAATSAAWEGSHATFCNVRSIQSSPGRHYT
jgi:hypothetical protein